MEKLVDLTLGLIHATLFTYNPDYITFLKQKTVRRPRVNFSLLTHYENIMCTHQVFIQKKTGRVTSFCLRLS